MNEIMNDIKKDIIIKSKRTRHILLGNEQTKEELDRREAMPNVPAHLQTIKSQYELLRNVHYNTKSVCETSFTGNVTEQDKMLLQRELTAKLNGYKQQDIKKKLFDDGSFITMEQIRTKLIDELLTCVFCGNQVKLFYDKVRDDAQWTLDRVDNDKGHSDDNTRIACLKCNLQRRRMDYDKFHWTKNVVITKL